MLKVNKIKIEEQLSPPSFPSNKVFTKTVNQRVDFLARCQREDGSFFSLTSSNPRSFVKAKKYHTIFPAFLVLSCLNSLEETAKIRRIKRKTVRFLLSQKNKHWSFNYWARDSQEAKKMPYPDDLDDTFCALSALFQYDPKLIDGSAMAKLVTLLTAMEKKEGGPYRTWLVPQDADEVWKDIDLVANSNIAYFLFLQDVSLPSINKLIESAIETKNYTSPYYASIYPIIYFISRFYKGGKGDKIKRFLLSKRSTGGKWENPQNTALAASSLLNLGVSPNILKKSINYLASRQSKSLEKPYPFVVELIKGKKKYYAGSPAMTTAFCLEAIGKYDRKCKMQNAKLKIAVQSLKRKKMSEEGEKIYKQVVKEAKKRFSSLKGELKIEALKCLKATLEKDKDKQIVLMPYFFKVSLGEKGKSVSRDFLVKLGLVNFYGWIAYTIYDDFLDEEGKPKLLSLANVCLRESTTIYNNLLPKESGFPVFLEKIVDTIDVANTWEVTHCRIQYKKSNIKNQKHKLKIKNIKIPDYEDFSRLAQRSLGHALGPAAIFFSLGYKASSSELKNLMSFFKHFLIARQLNDEAHDWEEDLKMGRINAVGAEILKNIKTKKHKNKRTSISPNEFQKVFWYEVVVDICQTVLKHTQLAQKALERIPIIANPSLLSKLFIPIEASAQEALKEREETIKFLSAYSTTVE